MLQHGLELLRADSGMNRRLAMISIDNSVELMIKTYLGLPRRKSGLSISRKEYADFSESFPGLLDALEKFAPAKLAGIDLGTIEWYHRLRNQLYHQGNGLTVERDKVEIYAELANILFHNLFGIRLVERVREQPDLLGPFIEQWVALEQGLSALSTRERARIDLNSPRPRTVLEAVELLESTKLFTKSDVEEINRFRSIRNEVLHGNTDHRSLITQEVVNRLRSFVARIPAEARLVGEPFTEKQ
jgi:hypothetical protein